MSTSCVICMKGQIFMRSFVDWFIAHQRDPADIIHRFREVSREYATLIHETANIGRKTKRALYGVFAYNIVVSVTELVLIGVTTIMMNAIGEDEAVRNASYIGITVAGYFWLRAAKDNLLEFVRDVYAERYFRQRLFVDLSLKGLRAIKDHTTRHQDIFPQLVRGRESWMVLVEFPIREAATIVLALPAFAQLRVTAGWDIAALALASVPLGIVATMAKDHYLRVAYEKRQKGEYLLFEHESDEVRGVSHLSRTEYAKYAEKFAVLHRTARIKSSLWDNIARDGVYNLMLAGALLLGADKLIAGEIAIGDFGAIIMLCDFARRPVQAVFSLQAEMQFRREALAEYFTLLGLRLHRHSSA